MKEDVDKTWMEVHGGYAKDMTMRDYFAGLAMQTYIADKELIDMYCHLGKDVKQEVAVTSYMMADAMLKAREVK
jgi:hypothetical protein